MSEKDKPVEKPVFYARAVIYYFDPRTKNWTTTSIGSGFGRVDMYENTSTNTFRVIGRGLAENNKTVVINSNVIKDTQYTRASETFHQWSDNRYIYGLNFPTKEEAENFGGGFEATIAKLKVVTATIEEPTQAPTPPNPPQNQNQNSIPQAPTPPQKSESIPQAPPQQSNQSNQAPNPPPPPTPPTPPQQQNQTEREEGEPEPTESRGALLSSIQGFKGGLKKVQTNDRSNAVSSKEKPQGGNNAPNSTSSAPKGGLLGELALKQKSMGKKTDPVAPPAKKQVQEPTKLANRPPSNSSIKETAAAALSTSSLDIRKNTENSGSSTITSADLIQMKEDILAEVKKELQSLKDEILAALNSR